MKDPTEEARQWLPTTRADFLQYTVADFVKGKNNIKQMETSEFEIRVGSLTGTGEIIILRSAM